MDTETIRFTLDGNVARIVLDRPEAMNAMNFTMMKELSSAAIACDENPDVRAVLLTGNGKAFCAGGDLGSFAEAGDRLPGMIKEGTLFLHGAISRFARMRAPLVVAVNGTAAGAGLSLAAIGDLVVTTASARFVMAYTRAGLVPDGSSTFFLPRVIGLRRTQELVFTNRTLDAETAVDWGLVTRSLPDEDFEAETERLVREIATGPTDAFGTAKRLLLSSLGDSLETQMEAEARGIAAATHSEDGKAGIAAFAAKQKPEFRGR